MCVDLTGFQVARREAPPELVTLSLTKATLKAAKNAKKTRKTLQKAGLTRWSQAMLDEKRARLEALMAVGSSVGAAAAASEDDNTTATGVPAVALTGEEVVELQELRAAIETQEHTRIVHNAGIAAAAAFANLAVPKLDRLLQAFAIGAAAMPSRAALFFNKTRLAENAKRARVRQRVLDTTVNQVVNFAGAKTPRNIDGTVKRLPVIYIGDRVNNPKASRTFPMKRFLRLLARKAIVVICSEHRTTKCCGDCGYFNVQPRKAYSAVLHRGTMYCEQRACPSQGRFTNRDVQAACNIVDRFICAFVLGGKLGLLSAAVLI